jgi:hypothetical protein
VELSPERATPYLRALQAGAQALAPHDDYVPLAATLTHLRALDPALSGDVLLPALIDDRSGMPAFGWMQRAAAEQAVARATPPEGDTPDDVLERAQRMDPALAARLSARRALRRFLRGHDLLPATHLEARLRRRSGSAWSFALRYDRMLAGAGWMRVSVELEGPARWSRGLFDVARDGTVRVDAGIRHLLARQCVLPLTLLHSALTDTLQVSAPRLSRTFVGPFWFPGGPRPDGAPDLVERGLVLHLSSEVMGAEVHEAGHRDPWRSPPVGERPARGQQIFRDRRFAATPSVRAELEAWCHARGAAAVVAPLVPSAD